MWRLQFEDFGTYQRGCFVADEELFSILNHAGDFDGSIRVAGIFNSADWRCSGHRLANRGTRFGLLRWIRLLIDGEVRRRYRSRWNQFIAEPARCRPDEQIRRGIFLDR